MDFQAPHRITGVAYRSGFLTTSGSTGAMSCPGAIGRPGVSESPGAIGFPGSPESPGAIESPGAAGRPGTVGGSGATTGGLGSLGGVSGIISGRSRLTCGSVAANITLLSTVPVCTSEPSTAAPTANNPTTAPSTSNPISKAYSIMDCPESWRRCSIHIAFVLCLQFLCLFLQSIR